MVEKTLREMATTLVEKITDQQLIRNLFTYLYFAELGSFKALQDLLTFVQTDGIEEILKKLNPELFKEFVKTVIEMSEKAPLE